MVQTMTFFTSNEYLNMMNERPYECLIVKQNLSFLQELFIFTGVIQFSFFIAFFLTSLGVHYIDWDYLAPLRNIQPKKEQKYTERYPLKIIMSKEERTRDQVYEEASENKNNNYVMESTPSGLVVMRHNYEDRVFEYFADREITYMTLETVARKYCNVFCVPEIFLGDTFVDYIYDSDEVIEYETESESEEETETEEKTKSNKPIIKERNTYRLMGMIRDYDICKYEEYKDVGADKEKQQMTFEMFKQMLSGRGSDSK
jgi:hypothetical protein